MDVSPNETTSTQSLSTQKPDETEKSVALNPDNTIKTTPTTAYQDIKESVSFSTNEQAKTNINKKPISLLHTILDFIKNRLRLFRRLTLQIQMNRGRLFGTDESIPNVIHTFVANYIEAEQKIEDIQTAYSQLKVE